MREPEQVRAGVEQIAAKLGGLDAAVMNAGVVDIKSLGDQVPEMQVFEGASSGLLGDDDVQEAAKALEPGTSAALLVYENCWAAPFAKAVRESGGQLVANGRIPVQAVIAALEATEETEGAGAAS
jgi:NAD(P)-dependent dehydrogenase (short-subunit alcohol dehydrogenase family)